MLRNMEDLEDMCSIRQFKAFVFDMDGLIFDSERIVQRSWNISGQKLGLGNVGEHIYYTLGLNRASRKKYYEENIREDFPFDEFSQLTRKTFFEIVETEGLPVKAGVKQILEYGKQNGIKLALATSSSRDYAMKCLRDAEIDTYFDGIVCGDMVSRSKPDPEIYLRACELVKVNPEDAVAFEDAPAGIVSAYCAGMKVIMVPDLVQPTEKVESMLWEKWETLREFSQK